MIVVLAGAAILTGNGFRRLLDLIVVLAGTAILTGNGFRRLPLAAPTSAAGNGTRGVHVLADAANFAVGLSCVVVIFGPTAIGASNIHVVVVWK